MPRSPTPFDSTWRPISREHVDFRRVGDDWILFDPLTQAVHVLSVTEALVWSHCSGAMDVRSMEAEIRSAFGAALPRGNDPGVRKALGRFLEAGLLNDPP